MEPFAFNLNESQYVSPGLEVEQSVVCNASLNLPDKRVKAIPGTIVDDTGKNALISSQETKTHLLSEAPEKVKISLQVQKFCLSKPGSPASA